MSFMQSGTGLIRVSLTEWAASTSGTGSTGAASTWSRIGLGPDGFGSGSTYYPILALSL